MPDKSFSYKIFPFKQYWAEKKEQWYNLYSACVNPCIFYHPAFLEAAFITMNGFNPSHIITGQKGETVVLGMPVVITQKAFGKEISLLSAPGFDHLMPLDCSNEWEATKAFFSSQRLNFKFVNFRIDNTDEEFASFLTAGRRSFFSRKAFRCPYLELPHTSADILSKVSTKFRYNLNRDLRRLGDQGVTFNILNQHPNSDDINNAFESLLELHKQRSDKKNITSKFTLPETLLFYKTLCSQSLAYPGLIRFCQAISNGKVVGSLMGFFSHNRFYFHQHGFTREYSSYSIGSILIYKMIESLVEEKADRFDFLRGADSYKFKWTNTFATDYFVVINTSLQGVLTIQYYKAKWAAAKYGKLKGLLKVVTGSQYLDD